MVLVCLLNMSIAMLAEYTVIGSLFKDFVGSVAYPMIIVVGVLTMIYTAYGGLLISILTDQLQAILTVIFIAILTIFVAATFRCESGWSGGSTGRVRPSSDSPQPLLGACSLFALQEHPYRAPRMYSQGAAAGAAARVAGRDQVRLQRHLLHALLAARRHRLQRGRLAKGAAHHQHGAAAHLGSAALP